MGIQPFSHLPRLTANMLSDRSAPIMKQQKQQQLRQRWKFLWWVSLLPVAAIVLAFVSVRSGEADPVSAGYRDFNYGTTASAPTEDKPQAKLWWNDGRWWGSLFSA